LISVFFAYNYKKSTNLVNLMTLLEFFGLVV
jgi:hypothetical protein